MLYNYDVERLEAVMQDFYNATGINISFYAGDFSAITYRSIYNNKYCRTIQETEEGHKKCGYSDQYLLERCKKTRKAQLNICHAGLIDVAVPVIYEQDILGYLVLGQMKTDDDFSVVEKYLKNSSVDLEEIQKHYQSLTVFNEEKVQSVVNLASMLARHILLEDILKPRYNTALEKAIGFIEENLDKELSVKEISEHINVSVSVLYKYFYLYFDCTPKEYINKRRVERSVKLLQNTDLSIEAAARLSGFASASYYTRIFKQIKGVTPLGYKKTCVKRKKERR